MTSPILSFNLPNSTPVLSQQGTNWLTFVKLFEAEMHTCSIWSHFNGSAQRPSDEDTVAAWEEVEFNAGYLLSEYLCDLMCLQMQ